MCSWRGDRYHVKVESSQANKGLPQSFSSAKLKKAAVGKENRAPFDLVKLRLGHLVALCFNILLLANYAIY